MSPETQIDQIADRIERLLLCYTELQQRNAGLLQELAQARQERDTLAQRMASATERLDKLLAQLPQPIGDPA